MALHGFHELGKMFEGQSRHTWQRLGFVRESYTSRGVLGPVRFGEETITDLMMMDMYERGSTVALFEQTSRRRESRSGTDFEFWLGSEHLGWFRFAIQAKKLDVRTGRYSSLTQWNAHGKQIDLLENYAGANRAAPLYCLYGYEEKATERAHWHCCTGCPDVQELGCAVTPSLNIREAINTTGAKNFKSIHSKKNTLPWRCLVSCPEIYNSLEAKSKGDAPKPLTLFDPNSCYHRRLPRYLLREGGRVIRENDNGGELITVPRSMYQDIPEQELDLSRDARQEFSERYSQENGVPSAAGVLRA